MCTVVLPAALRQFADGARNVEIEHRDGATLGTVLDVLAVSAPTLVRRLRDEQGGLRRFVNVYVDGEDVRSIGRSAGGSGMDVPVPAAAEVLILPSVAGG
jgi:sulfur-carrier protein